jgi:general secretion pathway protein C
VSDRNWAAKVAADPTADGAHVLEIASVFGNGAHGSWLAVIARHRCESRDEVPVRHALESFIRRRFFVVHLGLLAIAAILCARIVTVVVGHIVAEKLSASAAAQKAPPRPSLKPSANRDFVAAANANIFEGKREVLSGPLVPADTTPPPEDGTCDGSSKAARFRLVGTVVFDTPESSLASIVDEGKGGAGAEMFSINDCPEETALDPNDPDAKLQAGPAPCSRVGDNMILRRIQPERVCIWNEADHRMEYLAIDEPPEKGAIVASAPKVEKPAEPSTDDADIRKVGEGKYEVGQGEVDKALNNLAELSTQARIVPAFEGGKTVGFKLFSIRPGSLYSKIGLQNGDVITRINGYEMSSPEKGLEIYGKLKDAKQVTVDLKRRGKPQTLDYNITQ